ncbi:hypothetical protein [Nonomuraea sp. SYSU D8015]|uniref:hypothetical protein n=1 Tax=Nonomuraea sp. SYSU D8015 TaxID=2593644 RepID=UPI0016602E0F|nr:hypothetical protein [Nonomuraea sp. SYSU D8015]
MKFHPFGIVARLMSHGRRLPHNTLQIPRAHASGGELAIDAAVVANFLFSHGSGVDLLVCGGPSPHVAGMTTIAPAGYGGFASASRERVSCWPHRIRRLLPRMVWAVRLTQLAITLLCAATSSPRRDALSRAAYRGSAGDGTASLHPSPAALRL